MAPPTPLPKDAPKRNVFRGTVSNNAYVVYEDPASAGSTTYFAGRLKIGAYTYFGMYGQIGSGVIGRFCSIAPNLTMGLGEHPIQTLSTHPIFYGATSGMPGIPDGIGTPRDLTERQSTMASVGHDVWIGANVTINRGVKIGTGAILGAGSVITRSVPPYAIVGGVPARVIRYRYDPETIERLLASRWWDLPLSYFVGKDVKTVGPLCDAIERDRANGAVKDVQYPLVRLGRPPAR